MKVMAVRIVLAAALVASLAACNRNRTPELMNITAPGQGPDEFAILPNKPLQEPENFTALPPPTPGAGNRVDPTPEADAIIALGGNPNAASAGGLPAADAALVSQSTRFGVAQNIRRTLAAEDLDYRRRKDGRLMERVFNVNVYFKAYRRLSLDKYAELERLRQMGVRTLGPAGGPLTRLHNAVPGG